MVRSESVKVSSGWQSAVALTILGLAACNPTSGTVIIERGPKVVVVRGTVVSSSGAPVAGAHVRSRFFKRDCATLVTSERDTLVTTDSAGKFKGYVYIGPADPPDNLDGCVRAWATSAVGSSTSDTISTQVQFGIGTPSSPIDTATFHFVLP